MARKIRIFHERRARLSYFTSHSETFTQEIHDINNCHRREILLNANKQIYFFEGRRCAVFEVCAPCPSNFILFNQLYVKENELIFIRTSRESRRESEELRRRNYPELSVWFTRWITRWNRYVRLSMKLTLTTWTVSITVRRKHTVIFCREIPMIFSIWRFADFFRFATSTMPSICTINWKCKL